MMGRLNLTKGRVGANVQGSYTKCSAIVGVFGEITIAGNKTLQKDIPVKLLGIEDAVALGITKENASLLYHHVSEYFRLSGRGSVLWILSITEPEANTLQGVIEAAQVKSLIAEADGNIFQIAFSHIPTNIQVAQDGLPTGFISAVKSAQAFANWTMETNRPLHVVLEGSGIGMASADLRNLKEAEVFIAAPQVSVMIGQDYDFAESLTGSEKKYAAVGSVLGCMAAQPVNFNVGEVESMALTDTSRNLWVNAGIASHVKIKEVESQLESANLKGYIFAEYYSGKAVLNDDHNCVAEIIDADGNMNESSIALSRTNSKIFRELYKTYQPKIKTTYPVDKNGLLTVGMIKYFESLGNNVFDTMQAAQEISNGETVVDGNSNLLFGDKTLKIAYNWIPTGTVRYITGTVNIRKSL